MGAFVNLVYEYANYIILAGMLLQMIIILQVLVKVNRTDRRLQMIQGKVEDYLNVILTEDSGKEEPLVSRQEELMRDSIEKKRKQQKQLTHLHSWVWGVELSSCKGNRSRIRPEQQQ